MNRPARLNRTLLTLLGLLALAAGGFALAIHFSVLHLFPSTDPLLPTTTPTTPILYVTAAVSVIIGLLCLRWLIAQLARTPKTQTWQLESTAEPGHTALPAAVAAAPLTDDITTYEGVHTARATLAGTHSSPALALVVTVHHTANVKDIRSNITTHALPRLRQALDLTALPTTIEFRFRA
ncbi:alkaline shock response membrane anchor protein AmaP [Umezawaea sp. Da 62-37]|uniref:alkaline shock response membrane anchor protein AmaP n=1 Tax=Umezawaea sp. Da 62-37 TaxID=3075927 RepID=UPI0028F727AA|nr:alkaline shock response membrane anchor protein AmaP [Umezawaea sp. Da 62-37]WNV88449.1 alkaline shock response membrane anchor protein AmaP [Umezawaea sp. Da 62-37]